MVYDVTDPAASSFVQYVNTRLPADDPNAETELDDLGPEGIIFIAAADSPTGTPLVALANEVSGTTVLFEVVTASISSR